ncbi:MbtH family protein [Streptomyces avermitilis]|uniref:MbtH family protein n=1 Tax=Streptomyces avermitilis TaxID=33903 RepID=UPI0037FE2DFB
MDTSPFEDDTASYVVLVNHEAQRSLWPSSLPVPAGWTASFGPDTRRAAVAHVESTWTDLRPRGLAALDR